MPGESHWSQRALAIIVFASGPWVPTVVCLLSRPRSGGLFVGRGWRWVEASGPEEHGVTPRPLYDECIPAAGFGGGSVGAGLGGWSKAT